MFADKLFFFPCVKRSHHLPSPPLRLTNTIERERRAPLPSVGLAARGKRGALASDCWLISLLPCQSSSSGSPTAGLEWPRLYPKPGTSQTPWHLHYIEPRLSVRWTAVAVKLALCKYCEAPCGAWLGSVLVQAFSKGVLGWILFGTGTNTGVKTRCLKRGSDKCKKKQWKMRRRGS